MLVLCVSPISTEATLNGNETLQTTEMGDEEAKPTTQASTHGFAAWASREHAQPYVGP